MTVTIPSRENRKPQRSAAEGEHRTGEDSGPQARPLIVATTSTLWQSRGEVEHIPPDCLPGEGALPVNLTSSGNPANDQRVTRCHVLPTLGEAHTGSPSVQGSKGSGVPMGFHGITPERKIARTVPVKVKPEGSRQRERAGQLKTRKGQI